MRQCDPGIRLESRADCMVMRRKQGPAAEIIGQRAKNGRSKSRSVVSAAILKNKGFRNSTTK